ncbi:MAG: DUF3179 domain-containing protein, partial [Acidobacteriota bacterium]|nr:DUF3179 domain-containing protein [Acidobacteriota bacterium]
VTPSHPAGGIMSTPWKTKMPEGIQGPPGTTRRLLPCLLGPALVLAALTLLPSQAAPPRDDDDDFPPLELFFQAGAVEDADAKPALEAISRAWRDTYTAMLVELSGPTYPEIKSRLFRFLTRQTGQFFGQDSQRWLRWVWKQPYQPHPEYLIFKRSFYKIIDPRMVKFFPPAARSLVRLDEVQWGGVKVNGIPPLDHPENIPASEAGYLKDNHVVFGLSVGGSARAYPKRILAWHEMALDKLGGTGITLVYCTLCGTAIPYKSVVGGQHRTFGTSGLVYRANKLMFDHESNSLWSTLLGTPVIGKLAGSGLKLEPLPIVTTRWGEWRKKHPATTVLSLDTGHERDYREGQAYKQYFATDSLMFQVAERDKRLRNKAEILGIVLSPYTPDGKEQSLAVSSRFLKKNPVFRTELAGHHLTILTTRSGANRVFKTGKQGFQRLLRDDRVIDDGGKAWKMTEDGLVSEENPDRILPRIPAFRAFWFGWFAQYPETRLVK